MVMEEPEGGATHAEEPFRSTTPGPVIAPGDARAPEGVRALCPAACVACWPALFYLSHPTTASLQVQVTGADEEYMVHLNRVREFNDLRDQVCAERSKGAGFLFSHTFAADTVPRNATLAQRCDAHR